MNATRWWLILLMTIASLPPTARAHETDQFTVPAERKFADLGDFFNRWAYQAIDHGVNVTNAQIRQALAAHQPASALAELQSAPHVTMAVRDQWPWSVTQIEAFEQVLRSPRMRDRYPGRVVSYGERWAGVYENAFFPLDVREFAHLLFFSSTIEVYGTYMGTDKLGHFTDEGISYYFAYRGARDAGRGEREAIARAVLIGTQGLFSEQGLLGLAANADYSNADLSGNFAGFLFYRNLTEPVALKGALRPPMLMRDGPYWRPAADVRPDSGFFARFISDHLDEALNPGYFEPYMRPAMRDAVRARTATLLQHYCDEHGQPRTREWFDQKLRELSTYWGVDYGHLGKYDELVSIGNSCFTAVRPGARPEPSVDRSPQLASAVVLDAALRRACCSPGLEQMLIRSGANVNGADSRGQTALHWAASEPDGTAVATLLSEGADVEARDQDGRTPLQIAAASGSAAAVEALLHRGAETNERDNFRQTPLHLAAASQGARTIDDLLRAGAAPDAQDAFGRTPLHEAARTGSLPAVQRLLAAGASPNAADAYGYTPLHLACRRGCIGVVQLLLERGAQVSAASASGVTPLHEAALAGDVELARLLLDHGAHLDARDARGRVPVDVAGAHHYGEVVAVLRGHSGVAATPPVGGPR